MNIFHVVFIFYWWVRDGIITCRHVSVLSEAGGGLGLAKTGPLHHDQGRRTRRASVITAPQEPGLPAPRTIYMSQLLNYKPH